MNNLQPVQPISVDNIKTKIYEFRGQKVMLDRDLAALYQVETKRLNEAVKRNILRFPADFMFQLNDSEFQNWKSQFATSNSIKMGARKKPYAFTELGIAMLSSVLSSEIAIQVNIQIMRAFVTIKKSLTSKEIVLKFENIDLRFQSLHEYLENILTTQNDINDDTAAQLELINQTLAELQAENTIRKEFAERKPVGFKIEK
ncbi:MAG: ORF6N domain-containing protein [Bacteroidales bacterium]|nr:ORF6N domain-containing protein [Bacteroidales bacterium]